jgi:hypothetical protein
MFGGVVVAIIWGLMVQSIQIAVYIDIYEYKYIFIQICEIYIHRYMNINIYSCKYMIHIWVGGIVIAVIWGLMVQSIQIAVYIDIYEYKYIFININLHLCKYVKYILYSHIYIYIYIYKYILYKNLLVTLASRVLLVIGGRGLFWLDGEGGWADSDTGRPVPVPIFIHVDVYMCIYIYIYIYIYSCIYTYIYTHLYIYMYRYSHLVTNI